MGSDEVSIDGLKQLQRDADLPNLHLVWLGPGHFNLAHTDPERKSGEALEDCALHKWLVKQSPDDLPAAPGSVYVVVPYEPDALQASYGEAPYEFYSFEEWVA